MSEEEHHHHDDECHCHDHEHHEHTSMEEAGGVAVGLTGTFENFNSDAEARLANVLIQVGKFVQGESGCLLGHIKAAVFDENGRGITLNLIDMDNGVEHHGTLPPMDNARFDFMCAVLDVDEHELLHIMMDAIDQSGIEYRFDPSSVHHHHHDKDGHAVFDDDDDHEHHHHDDGECHCRACEERRQEEAAQDKKKESFWHKHPHQKDE